MSKTIYNIGAGASYGRRDEDGAILKGISVIAEIHRKRNPISVRTSVS